MPETHGTLMLAEGVVSARVAPNGLVDVAVAGELAGVELEVTDVRVHVGHREDYRSATTLSLDMRPHSLTTLMTVIANKLGMPAFTEREWLEIADVLDTSAAEVNRERAEQIRAAYR